MFAINSDVYLVGHPDITGIVEGQHVDGIAVAFRIGALTKEQMRVFSGMPFLNKGLLRRIYILPKEAISLVDKHARLQKETRKGSRRKAKS